MEISITNKNTQKDDECDIEKVNVSLLTKEQQKTYLKISLLEYFHNKIIKRSRDIINKVQQQEIYYSIYDIIYRIDDSLLEEFTDNAIILLIQFIELEASIKNITIGKKELYSFLKRLQIKLYNK